LSSAKPCENARKILLDSGPVKTLYDQYAFRETDLLTYNSRHYDRGCAQIPQGANMIHLVRSRATQEQLNEMLEELTEYVKLAVDIKREIVVGGGELHADCETVLLEDGSEQEDVWGADWWPLTKKFDTDRSSTFVQGKIIRPWRFSTRRFVTASTESS